MKNNKSIISNQISIDQINQCCNDDLKHFIGNISGNLTPGFSISTHIRCIVVVAGFTAIQFQLQGNWKKRSLYKPHEVKSSALNS